MAQSVQLHWRWNKANLSRDSPGVLPVGHLGLVHIEILASSIAASVQNPAVDMIYTGLRLGYVALVQIVTPPFSEETDFCTCPAGMDLGCRTAGFTLVQLP